MYYFKQLLRTNTNWWADIREVRAVFCVFHAQKMKFNPNIQQDGCIVQSRTIATYPSHSLHTSAATRSLPAHSPELLLSFTAGHNRETNCTVDILSILRKVLIKQNEVPWNCKLSGYFKRLQLFCLSCLVYGMNQVLPYSLNHLISCLSVYLMCNYFPPILLIISIMLLKDLHLQPFADAFILSVLYLLNLYV